MVGRLLAAALLLVAFAALAFSIPPRGGTDIDVAVSGALATLDTRAGSIVFTWVSWLGDTALSGILAAAVVMLVHRKRWGAAVTVAVASLGGMWIADALKPVFHRSRPDYAIDVLAGSTWSFPSGHAMASMVGFGVLAFFRRQVERQPHRRHLITATAAVLVLAVSFSRLYLGVHYLTDVLGGLLAGAVWLLLCLEVYRLSKRNRV